LHIGNTLNIYHDVRDKILLSFIINFMWVRIYHILVNPVKITADSGKIYKWKNVTV